MRSGRTSRRAVLNPRAFNVGAVLCDLADLTDLEVGVDVPERDLRQTARV